MKLPSSIVECLRRFCCRVPKDMMEFPISSAISISRNSLSSSILKSTQKPRCELSMCASTLWSTSMCTYISSTGLWIALVSGDATPGIADAAVSIRVVLIFCGSLGGDEIALPRKVESLMSASLRVSNAPRTVARNRSFCERDDVIVAAPAPEDNLCTPSGCCLRNRLSESAD